MKHLRFIIRLLLVSLIVGSSAQAQNTLNDRADNIVGVYSGQQGSDKFKVKIVKLTDGTYRGQVIWMEHDRDSKGNKIMDTKNPDRSLRSKPADRTVLFSGLRYDVKKHCWSDTKIYDPQRGVKAHMTAEFTADGRLRIKGSLLGIGESVYWQKTE